MKRIVLASNNNHKIKEFKEILKDYEVLSLADINFFDDIIEDGSSFFDNALIKSRTIHDFLLKNNLKYDIIADDSGLCCNALGGEPGIFSARYAGNHDDSLNRKKLISSLSKYSDKSAYFMCCIVLYRVDGSYQSFEGKSFGHIISEERGSTLFGYDCIFYSDDLGKIFGEASEDEKNSVSHRGRAIKELSKVLL